LPTASRSTSGAALGLDYGSVRVGVAISDALRITTRPLAALASEEIVGGLRTLLDTHKVGVVVVGLPISLAGIEGASATGARALASEVEAAFGIETVFADERFTTTKAEGLLRHKVRDRRERRKKVDAVAAAVMLQGWLDVQRATDQLPPRYRAVDERPTGVG
jgi:putative Holliday junction resolvase